MNDLLEKLEENRMSYDEIIRNRLTDFIEKDYFPKIAKMYDNTTYDCYISGIFNIINNGEFCIDLHKLNIPVKYQYVVREVFESFDFYINTISINSWYPNNIHEARYVDKVKTQVPEIINKIINDYNNEKQEQKIASIKQYISILSQEQSKKRHEIKLNALKDIELYGVKYNRIFCKTDRDDRYHIGNHICKNDCTIVCTLEFPDMHHTKNAVDN